MNNNLTPFPNGLIGLFEPFDQVAQNVAGNVAAGRDVLRSRIVPPVRSRTRRQVLASRHNSTITAIRECEHTFRRMIDEPDDTVSRIVADIHERGGSAIPTDVLVHLTEPLPDVLPDPTVAAHLLAAVGPWQLQGDWLADPNGDPTGHIIEGATRTRGRVDPDTAAEALTEWGIRPEWQQHWLTTRRQLRTVPSGDLIVWTPAKYRYTYGLALLGSPVRPEKIQQVVGCSDRPGSVTNILRLADNIIRVDARGRWALTEWGHSEYTSVPDAMSHAITALGGAAYPHEINQRVQRKFGVKEHSARCYMGAPRFVRTADKRIRLRKPDDPWTWRTDAPGARQGVFPHPGRTAAAVFTIDHNLRAGSGRRLPALAAQHLGIIPGDTAHFTANDGSDRTVTINWPDTSMRGPGLSTLRTYTDGTRDGDLLRLLLDHDHGEHSFTTVTAADIDAATTGPDPEQAWQLLVRLVGLPPNPTETAADYLQHVADTVGCGNIAELTAELEARGDTAIARLVAACRTPQPV